MSDRICRDCGHIFDDVEAKWIVERHNEIPGDFNEYFMICPCCGSDSIAEAAYCNKCYGAFLEEKLIGGCYCPDCLAEFLDTPYATQFAMLNANEFAEFVFEQETKKDKKNPQSEPVTHPAGNGESRLE